MQSRSSHTDSDPTRRRRFSVALLIGVAVSAVGCQSPAAPARARVATLILVPDSITLNQCRDTMITVQAKDANGAALPVPVLIWSSDDRTLVFVSGLTEGTVSSSDAPGGPITVRATAPNGVQGRAFVTVSNSGHQPGGCLD
jgi:hypothetical protein